MSGALMTWYLAICQDCEPRLPQPFLVESERDEWARQHREATTHHVVTETQPRADATP